LSQRGIQQRDLVGASLAVALPGRSIATNGSPVPPEPWSMNANNG
jgi:hypothetical protein